MLDRARAREATKDHGRDSDALDFLSLPALKSNQHRAVWATDDGSSDVSSTSPQTGTTEIDLQTFLFSENLTFNKFPTDYLGLKSRNEHVKQSGGKWPHTVYRADTTHPQCITKGSGVRRWMGVSCRATNRSVCSVSKYCGSFCVRHTQVI